MKHEEYSSISGLADTASSLIEVAESRLKEGPVQPPEEALQLLHALEKSLGDDGIGAAAALEEFGRIVVPASTGIPSPRYLGLINSTPFPVAAWADLLVSALNNNSAATHQSPAASAAEKELVRAFGALVGWPDAGGMIVSGGSIATLTSMLMMRDARFPRWRQSPGLEAEHAVIYTSEASHFSVAKAVRIAGFAESSLHVIKGGKRGALDAGHLLTAIERDVAAGRTPACVVATVAWQAVCAYSRRADRLKSDTSVSHRFCSARQLQPRRCTS